MASLITRPNGCREIQFAIDKKRKIIRLGRVSKDDGDDVRRRIERILAKRKLGVDLDDATGQWLNDITDELYVKLAKAGLVPPRCSTTLGQFLDRFVESKSGQAERSQINDRAGAAKLKDYFGPTKDLRTITPADADAWASRMRATQKPSTAGRLIRRAKTFFRVALRHEVITKNPFAHLNGGGGHDKERQQFVSRETMAKVLEACPSNRWRLIFALARFAALRVPSEIGALTWPRIRWDDKTIHIPGKTKTGFRIVPIAPELMPLLEAAFDAGEPVPVPDIRADKNLGTHARRIIEIAGVIPWPKTFQNLRASCESEWYALYPIAVAARWAGNSPKVALEHYNRVTADEAEMIARAAAQQKVAHESAKNAETEPHETA